MMDSESSLEPRRKRPAHGVHASGSEPVIVFLTVCTRNRLPWLAEPTVHRRLLEIWTAADAWLVGRYVLMPDHLHLFAAPGSVETEFDRWVRYWKSTFRNTYPDRRCEWQAHHWDTRLRSGDSYEAKWEYVRNNPVRHGLVTDSGDWPYQGELNFLPWHG